MTNLSNLGTTPQDDEVQAMLASTGNPADQLTTPEVFNRPSVTVAIPDPLKSKLGGVSDHIRNSLEETLLNQAIQNWSTLQAAMVQSFGELNTVGPQRFPLEHFLRDALEIIGMALRSHSMANVASADTSSAQVSLGLNPRSTENLSTPRMMMKLLQIIEKISNVTLEEAEQRKLYVAKIESIKRDKIQFGEKLRITPADTVENRAIRSGLELDISRMGPQIAAVEEQITKLDRRITDITITAGKILNVHYQPENLSVTVDGFIQAVRDVPTVASKVSPKELSKLSGNPSLSFNIELPKAEKVEAMPLETPVVRPPVSAKKAPVRARASTSVAMRDSSSHFSFRRPIGPGEAFPAGARLLDTIINPDTGMRIRVFSGPAGAMQDMLSTLPANSVAAYIAPSVDNDPKRKAAGMAAIAHAKEHTAMYAIRYEKYAKSRLPTGSYGYVKTYLDSNPIFFLNDFPVGMFDENGAPLPEESLVEFLILLYGGNFPIIGSC